MASGCGDKPPELAWKGPELHYEVSGVIDGRSVRIALTPEEASTTKVVRASRDWLLPIVEGEERPDMLFFHSAEIKLKGEAMTAALPGTAEFEIELKGESLPTTKLGTEIAIVQQNSLQIYEVFVTPNSLLFEIEMKDADDHKFFEESAQVGTFVLHEMSGTLSSDGVSFIPDDGRIGGSFHARWSTQDELHGSFTVKATKSSVDTVAVPLDLLTQIKGTL